MRSRISKWYLIISENVISSSVTRATSSYIKGASYNPVELTINDLLVKEGVL